jgi:hypothetical protein
MNSLYLEEMGLTGPLTPTLGIPTPPSLSFLSLSGNLITALELADSSDTLGSDVTNCSVLFAGTPYTYQAGTLGVCPAAYGLWVDVLTVVLDNNTLLGGSVSLDRFMLVPEISISNTGISYCYEGPQLAYAHARKRTIRGVRPAAICNRAVERTAITSVFGLCAGNGTAPSPSPAGTRSLNETFCRSENRIVFGDAAASLDCPAWSTFQTSTGANPTPVTLDVDPAWLRFWGCICPSATHWGYLTIEQMRSEPRFSDTFSLGEQETFLSNRSCQRCPPGLQCNSLAVPTPPHQAIGSVYPYFADGTPCRERAHLPYAAALLPCLHPAVCNQIGADDAALLDQLAERITAWDVWPTHQGRDLDGLPRSLAEIQCRDGHDPLSPLCGQCLSGYWADGFLCQRCVVGAGVMVALAAVAALCCLGVYLRHRVSLHVEGGRFQGQTTTIVLWYFQMSAALELSAQLNQVRSSRGAASAASVQLPASIDWLQPILSFRFWAPECLFGAKWDFKMSSAVLFSLPLLVPVLLVFRSFQPRTAAVLLSDLVGGAPCAAAREPWPATDVVLCLARAAFPPSHAARAAMVQSGHAQLATAGERSTAPWRGASVAAAHIHVRQCFLHLSPGTSCDGAFVAWAAVVFTVFSVGWPVIMFVSLLRGGDTWLSGPAHALVRPHRRHWFGTLFLARKLWFAIVLGGFPYQDAATLPTIVFTSLLVILLLQVRSGAASAGAR